LLHWQDFGREPSGAIENQRLLLEEKILGDDALRTTGSKDEVNVSQQVSK